MQKKIGFALGGLGGFNAHGVGFLQTASKLGVKPAIISCTSGMVAWTARWLNGEDLEPLLLKQIEERLRVSNSAGVFSAKFEASGLEFFVRRGTRISRELRSTEVLAWTQLNR